MLRVILEPTAFFLVPFAAYALYLVAKGRDLLDLAHWTQTRVGALTMAGLAAAIAGVLYFSVLGPRHVGAYTPAHIENGVLVPGRFE